VRNPSAVEDRCHAGDATSLFESVSLAFPYPRRLKVSNGQRQLMHLRKVMRWKWWLIG
jgi:hypothetical protein